MDSFIEEYLIAIGAKTDSQSFDKATSAIKSLEGWLTKLKYAATASAVVSGFYSIAKAAVNMMESVAKADMEYQKLARSMWVTKETAKGLKMAMDEMGASMDDIAWIPELREQFHRLREEINRFSPPGDADEQLKFVRSVGYDIQVLMIRLKLLKEWIVYYLVKYLKPLMDEFKEFIKWVSDKLGNDMPNAAKKLASVLGAVVSAFYAAFKVAGKIIASVSEWVERLPENVKKWGAVFAAVGAAIMAGPFGIFLAAISAAFILLQDFVYYMNGWSSSNTLAPVWAALLKFARGEGSQFLGKIEKFLTTTANLLDTISRRIRDLFNQFAKNNPKVKEFGKILLEAVKLPLHTLGGILDMLSVLMKTIDLWMQGKRAEAIKEITSGLNGMQLNPTSIAMGAMKYGKKVGEMFNGGGGGGFGEDVVNNASQFESGYQWMDPTGENTDSRNQCASFASQMMAGAGVNIDTTMNGDSLANQFKAVGAYHAPGEYEPQPGDLIDWAHHVGIYAGNGEYIARNSSGGVVRGNMAGMEKYFGALWGYGSVSELQAAKAGNNSIDGSYGDVATSGFVSGSNEMVMGGIPNYGGFNMGGISIGAINIGGTNATPQQIAQAVQDGVQGAINARYQRGFTT